MSALSPQEKQSVDNALGFVSKIIDCYEQTVPRDKQTYPSAKQGDEIKRILRELGKMNGQGLIDWEPRSESDKAKTDRKGIHLNPKFGGDSKNDYQLPGDYLLDDPSEGYFDSLWKLLEILFHEFHHYERDSGVKSIFTVAFFDLFFLLPYAIDKIFSLFGGVSIYKYALGHEDVAYRYCFYVLTWIKFMLDGIRIFGDPNCIKNIDKHVKAINDAIARQDP